MNRSSVIAKFVVLVLLLGLSASCFTLVASPQVSVSTVVRVRPSETDVDVGGTLSVSIVVESVQNLYGVDLTLGWNNSLLQFQSVNLHLGVESHPDGVLHEDLGSEIFVAVNNASENEYRLTATAVGPASSFNGSGTVFTVSFKALSSGISSLDLETELADHPPLGGTANLIEHTTIGGSVESHENGGDEFSSMSQIVLILVAVAVLISILGALFFFRKRHR